MPLVYIFISSNAKLLLVYCEHLTPAWNGLPAFPLLVNTTQHQPAKGEPPVRRSEFPGWVEHLKLFLRESSLASLL